jgi:outer membrane protein assembly factor BamB
MTGLECRSGLAVGHDGKIYAGAWGYVYCFNADCTLAWSYDGGRFTDAALDVDGSLFVADTTNGILYRFMTE